MSQSGLILHSAQSIPEPSELRLSTRRAETRSLSPLRMVPMVTAPIIDLTCLATRSKSAVVTHPPSSIKTLRIFDRKGSDSRTPLRGARLIGLRCVASRSGAIHGPVSVSLLPESLSRSGDEVCNQSAAASVLRASEMMLSVSRIQSYSFPLSIFGYCGLSSRSWGRCGSDSGGRYTIWKHLCCVRHILFSKAVISSVHLHCTTLIRVNCVKMCD